MHLFRSLALLGAIALVGVATSPAWAQGDASMSSAPSSDPGAAPADPSAGGGSQDLDALLAQALAQIGADDALLAEAQAQLAQGAVDLAAAEAADGEVADGAGADAPSGN